MGKTILVTGAGSGLGEGAALGLARHGHRVIATVEIAPQVAALRHKAEALGLTTIEVEKLDLLDPYDVAQALRCDVDILFNNAGIGEAGPVSEMPIDLVRRNFETNLFAPLALTQGFVAKWVAARKSGKVVFCSSTSGLFTPAGFGVYAATKHALEAIAEAMQQELAPFGIKVQTIQPGPYRTGFAETMADTPFRWLDDSRNFTKRTAMRALIDVASWSEEVGLDPAEMIARLVEIVPADEGKFRNVVPDFMEELVRESQVEAWDRGI
jgi:NAD(P)-dependent dehydrogenase (short-subunit alcohol dehydrogenase family)